MNLIDLQAEVATWHYDRFPTAGPTHVALKLAEEAGEACRAVVDGDYPSLTGRGAGSLADELGDVAITCAALAARAGINLEVAVARRWATVKRRGA